MQGWPDGCYEIAPELRLRLVVISELPRTRETLFVRLMGAGRALHDAWRDFAALPDDAAERSVVLPVLDVVSLEQLVGEAQTIHDEEAAMTYQEMQQIHEENKRRLRSEGRAEGRAEMILDILAARGIPVADGQRERLLACRDLGSLRAWGLRAATVATADALFAD